MKFYPGNCCDSGCKTKKGKKKPALSFLFVLHAKKGTVCPTQATIKNNKKGIYTLKMNQSDADQVLAFSNRPYRKVDVLAGEQLADYWKPGVNSFAADPPNAVLSGSNLNPVIVVLRSIKVGPDSVSFSVISMMLGAIERAAATTPTRCLDLTDVVLTVDSAAAIVPKVGRVPNPEECFTNEFGHRCCCEIGPGSAGCIFCYIIP